MPGEQNATTAIKNPETEHIYDDVADNSYTVEDYVKKGYAVNDYANLFEPHEKQTKAKDTTPQPIESAHQSPHQPPLYATVQKKPVFKNEVEENIYDTINPNDVKDFVQEKPEPPVRDFNREKIMQTQVAAGLNAENNLKHSVINHRKDRSGLKIIKGGKEIHYEDLDEQTRTKIDEALTENENKDEEKGRGLGNVLADTFSLQNIAMLAVSIALTIFFPPLGAAMLGLTALKVAAPAIREYVFPKLANALTSKRTNVIELKEEKQANEYLSLERKEALQNSLSYAVNPQQQTFASPQAEEEQQTSLNIPPFGEQQQAINLSNSNDNSNGASVQSKNTSGKIPDEATEEIHVISSHMNLTADAKHQVGAAPTVSDDLNAAKMMDRYNDNMHTVDHGKEIAAQMKGEDQVVINKTFETHIGNRSQETDRLPDKDEFAKFTMVQAVSVRPGGPQKSSAPGQQSKSQDNQITLRPGSSVRRK